MSNVTLPTMPELVAIIATESPSFTAWRNAQPDKFWKNWELSAIRIGYELGLTAQSAELAAISSQAPKPASAGGGPWKSLAERARWYVEYYDDEAEELAGNRERRDEAKRILVEFRNNPAIAAEADTATKREPWVCPAGFCERHGVIHV